MRNRRAGANTFEKHAGYLGRERWCETYRVHVATVEREYGKWSQSVTMQTPPGTAGTG